MSCLAVLSCDILLGRIFYFTIKVSCSLLHTLTAHGHSSAASSLVSHTALCPTLIPCHVCARVQLRRERAGAGCRELTIVTGGCRGR